MFIWTTAEDHLVDPAQSLWMALALNKHKIPYEMHIFEKGDAWYGFGYLCDGGTGKTS